MKFIYTYILMSDQDGAWYTGYTSDLKRRMQEHNSGQTKSLKGRMPVHLIYYEACLTEQDAIAREKYLKSGMGKRYIRNRLKSYLSQF